MKCGNTLHKIYIYKCIQYIYTFKCQALMRIVLEFYLHLYVLWLTTSHILFSILLKMEQIFIYLVKCV